jgi:monovalent cation/hydrogen antiporter
VEHAVVVLVLTLLVISAAACLAPRLGLPAQVVLVLAGIGISLLPFTPDVAIDPQLILLGLLPPLLYASATTISATNFRRDFRAINGLSIILVVLSSLGLGALFNALIPNLGFGWGAALGAILSPTDAVATSIIKGRGVPERAVVILEGESLLNDASALVVLRTAIVATSVGFSFWKSLGTFAYSVAIAIAIGVLAARLNIALRRRVHDEAVNTILSFTTPFLAAVPAELLHGSGLVAAVVAGLVTGVRAPRDLPPGHRMSDARNWASVQLVLEGLVFLTMGLQLPVIFQQVEGERAGVGYAFEIAGIALVATILIRTAYVSPLLWGVQRSARRWQRMQPKVVAMHDDLKAGRVSNEIARRTWARHGNPSQRALGRLAARLRRGLADIDYLSLQPLGIKEGLVVVWAGMRGAVTVAAAQLLPAVTPHRSMLILIAFLVAILSLLLQGGTVAIVVRLLFSGGSPTSVRAKDRTERERIRRLLDDTAASIERPGDVPEIAHRLIILNSQRLALLDARDEGMFEDEHVQIALRDVDVDELVLRLRGITSDEGRQYEVEIRLENQENANLEGPPPV